MDHTTCWILFLSFWCSSIHTFQTVRDSSTSNCSTKCGKLTIEFPFGISPECAYNERFYVECNHKESKGLLTSSNLQVVEISPAGEIGVLMEVLQVCYNNTGGVIKGREGQLIIPHYFSFSVKNRLFAIGCEMELRVDYNLGAEETRSRCSTTCLASKHQTEGTCSGRYGCCELSLHSGIRNVGLHTKRSLKRTGFDLNSCTFLFFVEGHFNFSAKKDLINLRNVNKFPVVLDWTVDDKTCEEAGNKKLCGYNTICINGHPNSFGYNCICQKGFEGNPYFHKGCKDIDECKRNLHSCIKYETCVNTIGSFRCKKTKEWLIIVLASTIGFLVLVLGVCGLVLKIKHQRQAKREARLKEKRFEENGGVLLAQRLLETNAQSSNACIKIFTEEEIKAATDNYSEGRKLGEGGQGIVYKGILSDSSEVAVKRARVGGSDQVPQFINEVVVLSQINHPHVVRLLGCCLETEIPLLVYEIVSGGTLSEKLHGSSPLPWEDRLRIASEVAGTLAHLHSSAPMPIVHRDVKPANILLDDKLSAKVSDFGSSKLFPADIQQLTTLVQGTIGYLDPEYLQTSTLTEKSDVYSFGVVLMELVSGQRALCFNRPETQQHLVPHIETALNDNRLSDVIDQTMVTAENQREMHDAALIAVRCTKMKGEERPNMSQVAEELQGLRASGQHGSDPSLPGFESFLFDIEPEFEIEETNP